MTKVRYLPCGLVIEERYGECCLKSCKRSSITDLTGKLKIEAIELCFKKHRSKPQKEFKEVKS